MTRRATLVGAKRYAAAGGGYRRDAEVRKQGELRNAPSEQGDCVFEGQARQSLVRLTRRSLVQVQPPQPQRSRSIDLLFFSSRVMTRQATLVGAKRYAAAGGGYRRDAEVRKQGELRNAPSEQGDCVFEGQARQSLARLTRRSLVQVQPPQPQRSRSKDLLFFSSRVMTRRATLVGAKRYAAAGGGYRRDAEVRKQGELRNAPSEQGDCVFEGQARQSLVRLTRRSLVQVQPPQPQRSRSNANAQ